jgi:hypothetical protein
MKICKTCNKKLERRNKTGFCSIHSKGRLSHNMSKTPTYRTWSEMKYRCNNPNSHSYFKYGGVGIKVCDRWNRFENFLEDMGERPDGMSIDRIDNTKGYSPDNCRWADPYTQASNKRNVRHYKGLNMSEWDRKLGFRPGTMRARITVSKWTWEKATTTPKFKRGYRKKL